MYEQAGPGPPPGGGTGTVTSVGLTAPAGFGVAGSPVTAAGTLALSLVSQASGLVLASPAGAAGVPSFRGLQPSDIAGGVGTGTVTSVGLALPASMFTVTGSPVTGAGVLTGALASQTANFVLAAPDGANGVPTFRHLVAGDVAGLSGGGTVTSVGLTAPAGFTVGGSPVIGAGTLALGIASQTAAFVLAAPTAAPGVPTFRALVAGDVGGLGTFATQNFATPPAIGGTTPAAGTFSALTATGVVSGAGFTNYLAAPPAIGGTTPAAGAFTSLAASLNVTITSAAGQSFIINNSSTPSPTVVGNFQFRGNNAGATAVTWASVQGVARVTGVGSEEGALYLQTLHPGGTLATTDFSIDNGAFYAGAPTALKLADSSGNLFGVNLTVTGVVGGAGVNALFASPPPIGGTAANTGAFSSVTAGGTIAGALHKTGNGTAASPGYQFTNFPQFGWSCDGTSLLASIAGIQTAGFVASGLNLNRSGGTNAVPILAFNRTDATLASASAVGQVWGVGPNVAGGSFTWVNIAMTARVATAGLEEASLTFFTLHGGTLTADFTIDAGVLYAGAFAGGQKVIGVGGSIIGIQASPYSRGPQITGFTQTVPDNANFLIITPAGVLATGTVIMPANPVDGHEVTITTTQTITGLTVSANAGQNISAAGNITTLAGGAFAKWKYSLGVTNWYRVG